MDEQEWLSSTDPRAMLNMVLQDDWVSDRKLRLFGCASARLPWPVEAELTDAEREVIDTVEQAVDDSPFFGEKIDRLVPAATKNGIACLIAGSGVHAAQQWCSFGLSWKLKACQAEFFRDLVGNPWEGHTVDCAWLTPTVLNLAGVAYETGLGRFLDIDRLLVLSDALEEAGCEDTGILNHLRGGVHVRGCWVLDLLLGKE